VRSLYLSQHVYIRMAGQPCGAMHTPSSSRSFNRQYWIPSAVHSISTPLLVALQVSTYRETNRKGKAPITTNLLLPMEFITIKLGGLLVLVIALTIPCDTLSKG
jgi:hypothetical protein